MFVKLFYTKGYVLRKEMIWFSLLKA